MIQERQTPLNANLCAPIFYLTLLHLIMAFVDDTGFYSSCTLNNHGSPDSHLVKGLTYKWNRCSPNTLQLYATLLWPTSG